MQLVTRILSLSRALRLGRQARQIETAIHQLPAPLREVLAALTVKELANAARAQFPHLYGSAPERTGQAWGDGTEIALERARSDNPQVRMRGIALWVAVVYHQTRDAEPGPLSALHRQVLRLLRLIKDAAGTRPEVYEAWSAGRSEAA